MFLSAKQPSKPVSIHGSAQARTSPTTSSLPTAGRYLFLFLVLMWNIPTYGNQAPVSTTNNSSPGFYYVSPSGNDLNPGTYAAPWRTIQKAANSIRPGNTVLIANGNYSEIVVSTTAGTAAAPITFRAVSDSAVVSGFNIGHPFHTITGFSLTGAGVQGFSGTITIKQGGDSLLVSGNRFNGSPANVFQVTTAPRVNLTNIVINGNSFLNGNYHAIKIAGSYNTISSNLFTSPHGWDAINLFSSYSVIRGNNFIDFSNLENNSNHPDLVQTFDNNGEIALHVVIEGNFAYRCQATQIGTIEDTHTGNNVADWTWRNNIYSGVEWAMSLSAPNMKFYNNVFYRSGINTAGPLLFRNSDGRTLGNNGQVINNLFIECGDKPNRPEIGWYNIDQGVTGFSADYNLVIGIGAGTTKSGFATGQLEPHGINGLAPLFVNASLMNFRLQPSSPASGSGLDLSALFTTDFTGSRRVGRWSRGAY